MSYTYEQIKPIIEKEELDGHQMKVSFRATGQDTAIESVGVMMADQKEIMKNAGKSAVKQSLFSSAIRWVSGLVGGAVGGAAGSAAYSATSSVGHAASRSQTSGNMAQAKDTPENRQKAVVAAFQSVASFYEFDSETNAWKAKDMSVPPPA